jgi:hypothetical protein
MQKARILVHRVAREAFRRTGPFACIEEFPGPRAWELLTPSLSEPDARRLSKLGYLEQVLAIYGSSNLRRFEDLFEKKRTVVSRATGPFQSPYATFGGVPYKKAECVAAAKKIYRETFASGGWRRLPGKKFETDTPAGRYAVVVDFGSWSSNLDMRMRFRDLNLLLSPNTFFDLYLEGYLSYRDPIEFAEALENTINLLLLVPARLSELEI